MSLSANGPMKKIRFEITVPVLNEEKDLEKNIMTLYDFCMAAFPDSRRWSIVIADNGSTDRTQEIGRDIASRLGNATYLRLAQRGVGLALKTSWGSATADIVGSMDLDLSTDLRHLPEAIAAVSEKGYDIACGTRLHRDSQVAGRSLKREITSRVFNSLVRHYLHVSLSDCMCGFTFFRRSLLSELLDHGAASDGWFFQAEVLIVSEWLGAKIAELPVDWTDDTTSKVRILPLALEYLREMKTLKGRRRRMRYDSGGS